MRFVSYLILALFAAGTGLLLIWCLLIEIGNQQRNREQRRIDRQLNQMLNARRVTGNRR